MCADPPQLRRLRPEGDLERGLPRVSITILHETLVTISCNSVFQEARLKNVRGVPIILKLVPASLSIAHWCFIAPPRHHHKTPSPLSQRKSTRSHVLLPPVPTPPFYTFLALAISLPPVANEGWTTCSCS